MLVTRDGRALEQCHMTKYAYNDKLDCFRVGVNVQAHPATDTWMRGDRFGRVETIGRKYVSVRMHRSKRLIKFSPDNLLLDI